MFAAARQAFVGTLIDGDLIGHGEGLENAAARSRTPAIQTKQTGAGRLLLHHDCDVLQPPAKAQRNARQRSFDDLIELGGGQQVSAL